MIDIQNNLMPLRYSQIKDFPLNTTPGPDLSQNIPPSAEFIQIPVQYNYKFQQNPFVKYTGDEREEVNIQKRMTFDGYHFVEFDAERVPVGPKTHIPPEHTLTPYVRNVIASIRSELASRPIITRHLLYNRIGWDKRDRIREAAVYCGYFFTSGPWREALIVWGLDPRQDPAFRHFQTISFQSFIKVGTSRSRYVFDQHVRDLANMSATELQTEHTFDGINVSRTGNIFQFCDISDPIIRKILDVEDIRTTCAPTFQGWYHIGTWAKATVILKDKMNRIIEWHKNESQPRPDDSIYERILEWPENWNDEEIYARYKEEMHDKEVHRVRLKEHTVMHMVRWAARNPRYAFEKIEAKNARQIARENGDDMEDVDAEGEDDLEALEVPEDHTEPRDDATAIMIEGGEDESDEDEEDETGTDMQDEDAESGDDRDEANFEVESDDENMISGRNRHARPS
jgi:general transcription factor 3C polypeptide 5 (transcription factor C subunit 1)